MFLPIWAVVIIGLLFIGTIYITIRITVDKSFERIPPKVITKIKTSVDSDDVQGIIDEEIEGGSNEFASIITDAYNCHYREFKNGIVDDFTNEMNWIIPPLAKRTSNELIEKVIPNLAKIKTENFILPTGVKQFYQRGNSTTVLIECQPGLRSVTFAESILSDEEKMWNIH